MPENTMVSFERAVGAGAIYLELDVHMTRDGEVVVSHDPHLTRTCGRDIFIKDMTWAELQRADAGYLLTFDGGATFPFRDRGIRVPRLAEVLGAFVNVNYNIEIKQTEPNMVSSLFAVIDAAGARRRVLVASELDEPLKQVREVAPRIPTSFSYGDVSAFLQAMGARDPGYSPPGDALQIPPMYGSWKLVTAESVEFAHRAGVEVHVWTVNEEAEMNQMLECGVDGLISDFPARALTVARAGQSG